MTARKTTERRKRVDKETGGTIPDGQLGDWSIPEIVQTAAEEYDSANKRYQKAKADLNTARDNVIAAMKEHDVATVPLRDGAKKLVMSEVEKLTIEKPKKGKKGADGEK